MFTSSIHLRLWTKISFIPMDSDTTSPCLDPSLFTFIVLAEMNSGTCIKITFTNGCCKATCESVSMVQFQMVTSLRVKGGKMTMNKILSVLHKVFQLGKYIYFFNQFRNLLMQSLLARGWFSHKPCWTSLFKKFFANFTNWLVMPVIWWNSIFGQLCSHYLNSCKIRWNPYKFRLKFCWEFLDRCIHWLKCVVRRQMYIFWMLYGHYYKWIQSLKGNLILD